MWPFIRYHLGGAGFGDALHHLVECVCTFLFVDSSWPVTTPCASCVHAPCAAVVEKFECGLLPGANMALYIVCVRPIGVCWLVFLYCASQPRVTSSLWALRSLSRKTISIYNKSYTVAYRWLTWSGQSSNPNKDCNPYFATLRLDDIIGVVSL